MSTEPKTSVGARLTLRNATLRDAKDILALVDRSYTDIGGYTLGMIQGQISTFAEGKIVAEYDGAIVGYCATFIIDEATAFAPHSWMEITGSGYGSRHDPDGDWLYGMDVCVDPAFRRLRIGQRLYDARRRLCEQMELKGIVFGGRLPGYAKRRKTFETPQAYLDAIQARKVHDQVASFQLRAGFEPMGVLENYLSSDKQSLGFAAKMVWRNPNAAPESQPKRLMRADSEAVRIATVQLQMRAVKSFEEFASNIEYFVDVTADYRADFVVFPELCTLQLLSMMDRKLNPEESIEALTRFTPQIIETFQKLAISYNINIIGGSHPTRSDDGDIHNVAYVFLRDGSVHAQEKIHPTPNERYWWNIKGGDTIETIDTDCGPIGVMICYDSEFPEVARRLVDQGARLLFVPFCTDSRQGYMRVRYCCQARAIENQCYVIMAGNVGNLPGVENMDIQYAQSCILTPCDFPFARDGIAAEATENVETVTVADVNIADLNWARAQGSVRNLRDRRFDLYRIDWLNP